MRLVLVACVAAIVAAGVCVVAAEDASPKPAAPWSIGKIARCEDVQPGALTDKTNDNPAAKYLHVRIALGAANGDGKLHEFRVTDEKGKTVAEIYGFHKGRSVLVFEGNWSHLEGLYVEGGGHREPLVPAPPSRPPIAKSEPKPPVVMSRRPSPPAKSAIIEGVEPEAPAAPEPQKGEMHARQEKPPRRAILEESPSEKEKKLYQEVLVTQRSRVNIQGLDFDGDLQYRVLSSLTIDKRNPDGSLSVTQKVEQAEVVKADPLTQSTIGGLLGNLVGATFQITVGPDGRVVDFRGAKGRIRAAADNNPLSGQSFLMASILDPDGWREIADLTFFRPPKTSEGETWDRAISHSWGPLGSWRGKVAYARAGQGGTADRIRYSYRLSYDPPKAGANGLPFQIVRADFKHQDAGGTIAFDGAKGRMTQAEEHFPVKGSLTIGLLGQESPVGLEEIQDFRIRILEHAPVAGPRR